MQSLAPVGLCRRSPFLLACLRSLFRVPHPVADSLANAWGLAVAPPDRRTPCRIHGQATRLGDRIPASSIHGCPKSCWSTSCRRFSTPRRSSRTSATSGPTCVRSRSAWLGWCSRRFARSPRPRTRSSRACPGKPPSSSGDRLADRPAHGGDHHAPPRRLAALGQQPRGRGPLQRRHHTRGLPRRGQRRRGRELRNGWLGPDDILIL
jgi:hypothetical protein